MNNSKSSRFSIRSYRPDSFRVMMKQRTNHKQQLVEAKRVSASQLIKRDEQIPSPISQMNRTQNYSQMKDYVRNRMKTQYGQRFGSNVPIKSKLIQLPNKSPEPQPLPKKKSTTQSSEALNRTINKSFLQIDNPQAEESNTEVNQKVVNQESLDQMQQTIEELLEKRLRICSTQKSNRNQGVEQQLSKVVASLRHLRKEDPETIDAQISYFDKKVKLFEKLMAQSLTESEIIKKDFLAKVSNRGKHRRFNTEIQTSRLSMHRYNQTPILKSIINSTINKQAFKTPELAAYKIYKHKNVFFNADRHRQPLPRSSYNREYLVCPQSVDKQVLPIDNQFIGKISSPNPMQTSYRQSFKAKQAQKINLKELDAYKDKIKDMPVLYGRSKNETPPKGYNGLLLKIRQASYKKMPIYVVQNPSYKKLLSESRREYRRPQGKTISSQIKHHNLHKLKFQYRKKMCV